MKNFIKTIRSSSLVVLAAVALVASAAGVASAQANVPRDPSSKQAIPLEHIGAKVCRVSQSANQVFCAAGAGRVYEVCAFGTNVSAGKGAMAFDTVSSSQWLAGSPTFQTTYSISPIVYGTAPIGSTDSNVGMARCWKPIAPVRFESGLGILADSNSVSILATYRLDTGVNP